MSSLPKKAAEPIRAAIKKFQPILQTARTRDVNESDTVVIVADLLQELFGYDKTPRSPASARYAAPFAISRSRLAGRALRQRRGKDEGRDGADDQFGRTSVSAETDAGESAPAS